MFLSGIALPPAAAKMHCVEKTPNFDALVFEYPVQK